MIQVKLMNHYLLILDILRALAPYEIFIRVELLRKPTLVNICRTLSRTKVNKADFKNLLIG